MAKRILNIMDLEVTELEDALKERGVGAYRARQIFDWIYRKGVYDFLKMTNISKPMAERINRGFKLDLGEVTQKQRSQDDRSMKLLIQLHDGGILGLLN